ncbi:MAG: hypothetical protein ACYSUD_11805 [Planctomycetota bacterium]|jgi:hypothetical protein
MRNIAFSTAERKWCGICARRAGRGNNAKIKEFPVCAGTSLKG